MKALTLRGGMCLSQFAVNGIEAEGNTGVKQGTDNCITLHFLCFVLTHFAM